MEISIKSKKERREIVRSDHSDEEGIFEDDLFEELIYPGLVLKDNYVLLIKIGYGNNAGVWMAYQIDTKTYVAMKIQDHECYKDGRREVQIMKKINELTEGQKINTSNCVTMLDFFIYIKSVKIKFVCSVYPLYAGSIHMLILSGKYKYGLPIAVVKNISRQLLNAIIFLNTKAEVIHTDIKPENILFQGVPKSHTKVIDIFYDSNFQSKYDKLKNKYAETDEEKFITERDNLALNAVSKLQFIDETFENHEDSDEDETESDGSLIEGEDDLDSDEIDNDDDDNDDDDDDDDDNDDNNESEEEINTRNQSVPDYESFARDKKIVNIDALYDFEEVLNKRETTTDKVCVVDDMYVVNDCKIAVTDFGSSFFYATKCNNEVQDRLYRSPEVILDYVYTYSADMWSFGCVVFELLTGYPLFNLLVEPLNKDIHHLYLMEKIVGPLPLAMRTKSKRSKFLFDRKRNYHIKNIEKISKVSISNILVKQHLFSIDSAREIENFLMLTLRYNWKKRATPQELLKHPWLANI